MNNFGYLTSIIIVCGISFTPLPIQDCDHFFQNGDLSRTLFFCHI